MDMFGWAKAIEDDSFSATYWVPEAFSMYQISLSSAMKTPEPPAQPAVS